MAHGRGSEQRAVSLLRFLSQLLNIWGARGGGQRIQHPVGSPHGSPGAAGLWDPPLPAAGRCSAAGAIRVRVIRASWVTTHPAQPQAGIIPASISGTPSALRGRQQCPMSSSHEGFRTQLAETPSWPHHVQLLVTATGCCIHLPAAQTPPQPQEPGLLSASSAH